MGAALLAAYCGYLLHMLKSYNRCNGDKYIFESLESRSILTAILTFDFNRLLWKDRPLTIQSAIVNLSLSVAVIAIACDFLSKTVVDIAQGLQFRFISPHS